MRRLIRKEDVCDQYDVINIIHKNINRVGVYLSIDKLNGVILDLSEKKYELNKYLRATIGVSLDSSDKDLIRTILNNIHTKYRNVPRELATISQKCILPLLDKGLIIDEELVKVLKSLLEVKTAMYFIDLIESIMDREVKSMGWDYLGSRMLLLKPRTEVANTGRYKTKDPNVQGFSSMIKDCITVPKGVNFIKVDSGQIEPRLYYGLYNTDPVIKACIEKYDDAYFGLMCYMLMSDEELAKCRENPAYVEHVNPDKMSKDNRKMLKTSLLAVAYGGNVERFQDEEINNGLLNRMRNHPYNKRLMDRIKQRVHVEGIDYCTTWFGTKIYAQETPKYINDGSLKWLAHVERSHLNNYLQGTAADLLGIAISRIDEIIENFRSNPYTSIPIHVHDAVGVYIADEDMHLIKDIFDCVFYQMELKDGSKSIPVNAEIEKIIAGGRYTEEEIKEMVEQ